MSINPLLLCLLFISSQRLHKNIMQWFNCQFAVKQRSVNNSMDPSEHPASHATSITDAAFPKCPRQKSITANWKSMGDWGTLELLQNMLSFLISSRITEKTYREMHIICTKRWWCAGSLAYPQARWIQPLSGLNYVSSKVPINPLL